VEVEGRDADEEKKEHKKEDVHGQTSLRKTEVRIIG